MANSDVGGQCTPNVVAVAFSPRRPMLSTGTSGGAALRELFDRHGSDKGTASTGVKPFPWPAHTYAEIYASFFDHCRETVVAVFECEVGTNYPDIPSHMGQNGIPGASLRAWREYFPNAEIYGADIDERILIQEERIHTLQVDQTNEQSVQRLWQAIDVSAFDLMIDDGLHTFDAGRVLFENSIERLAPRGIYIIEDVCPEDLISYGTYFASRDFFVTFVQAPQGRGKPVGDNALVVIRKSTKREVP